MSLQAIQWGNVPTWLAFIGAGLATTFTWRALRRERRRDEARESAERRAQANKVAAWVTMNEDANRTPIYSIVLRNGSDLPIYYVYIAVHNLGDDKIYDHGYFVAPPDAENLVHDLTENTSFPISAARAQGLSMRQSPGFNVKLSFFDSAGIQWMRSGDGSGLKEIGSSGVKVPK